MNIDFDKLEALLTQSGKSKAHLCRIANRSPYYLRDVKKANINIPHDIIEKWAEELNTTPEYLKGETDIKEKPTAEAMSFEDIVRAIKGLSREELIELAIAVAKETGER